MEGEASTGSLTETQTPEAAPVEPQTPAVGQPPIEKPATGFDYEWWKKDPRNTKIWGKTKQVMPVPVDGIKSWHEADKILETKYKPAYKQYEGIVNRMKELGYDPDKVDDFFNEVQTLKDPNSPKNAVYDFMAQWQDTPYFDEIEKFFKDLNLKKLQAEFPGYTPEGIQRVTTLQAKVEKMEAEKEAEAKAKMAAHNEEVFKQLTADIAAETAKIKEECKTMGFEFNDEVFNKLMEFGKQEGLHPRHLKYAFKELFADDLAKLSENKMKSKLMTDKDKKQKTTVPYTRKPGTPPKGKFEDNVRDELIKIASMSNQT